MMIQQIALYAVMGLAFGRLGLWSPEQDYDPNNPINPWARRFVEALGAVIFGFITQTIFGKEQLQLSALGAIAGSMIATGAVRSMGLLKARTK